VRSKLPFEQLGAIWNLADTRARGALDLTDFIIGMHFLQATMNGSLATLPAQLPPGLYEQASGGTSLPLTAQNTGGSASGALPRQLTGSGGYLPRQLTGQQGYGTPVSPQASGIRAPGTASFLSPQRTGFAAQQAAGGDWSVSAADKAKADRFFDGLDTERKGTLEGQAAVPFFMQSGLPEATLAHVWDLSDITQSGSLSREEFAVAMHLINGALAGQQMPQELPEALIPPTLRGQNLPAAVNPQGEQKRYDACCFCADAARRVRHTARSVQPDGRRPGAAAGQYGVCIHHARCLGAGSCSCAQILGSLRRRLLRSAFELRRAAIRHLACALAGTDWHRCRPCGGQCCAGHADQRCWRRGGQQASGDRQHAEERQGSAGQAHQPRRQCGVQR
jgi:epidermal growth factor receptor substrate 15